MANSLNIIVYSGTVDKLIPVGVLTQTAANMEMRVRLFVTGWALLAFKKDGYKDFNRMPNEFSDLVPALMEGMAKTKTPSWYEMVKAAKEMGDVKIHACSLMTGVMGLKKEDLDPIVDDIVGAASFMQEVQGEQVIFI